jgi:RNA polymerase-binding transcription factor DksA
MSETTARNESVDEDFYRNLLLEARARVVGDSSSLRRDADSGNGRAGAGGRGLPTHLADAATDTIDQEFALDRLSASSDILQEIDEALDRIDAGRYGQCEGCGGTISERRLRIKPYAALCVACQQAEESS